MNNKKKHTLILAAASLLAACQYEPKIETGTPDVIFEEEALSAHPGETVTVIGTAEDPAGIRSISLQATACDFSRTIDLSAWEPVSYTFSADVVIPESVTPGDYEFTATISGLSGSQTQKQTITVTEAPPPVIDEEAPVITLDSPLTAKVGEPYDFSLTFSDDVGIIECWPKLHITKGWSDYPTMDGAAYDTGGYSLTVSGKETTITYTLVFPSGGDYQVIVYDSTDGISDGIHTLERADDWSVATFTISVERPASSDTEAPTITMNSPATAVLGQPYTLSLTFADESELETAWPLVKVYCGDVMPQELVDNWNGWWPEVSGSSVTVEQALTFPQAGEYKVWIDPVSDKAGNATEGKEWFTIIVSDGSAPVVEPPSVTMTSAGTATVGVPYTLTIDFSAPKGFVENWPKITVWGNFDPWPKPLDNDWFTLAGASTSYQYAKDVTFSAAGEYKVDVYTDSTLSDAEGNTVPSGTIGTIIVNE